MWRQRPRVHRAKTLNNPNGLVSNALLKAVGQRPPAVTCPSDIRAKAGHVFTCKVTITPPATT